MHIHSYNHIFNIPLAALAGAALLAGCGGSDAAPGTVDIAIYGEAFIEEGIPPEAFVHGWSVTFDRFLVSVGDLAVAEEPDSEPVLSDSTYRIIDLAVPSGGAGQVLVSADVDGGDYHAVSYRLGFSDGAIAGDGVSEADVTMMTSAGYALYVEGSATRDADTRTFAWGFTTATRYSACEASVLVDGNAARAELTIHADHLFYDDLVSESPNVAFDAVADADADADADITRAELEAVDIRGFERYQVGSFPVTDLWTFIDYQASTVGHIDGEGHCADAERSE